MKDFFYFRRPYRRFDQGEYWIDAIVAYKKTDMFFDVVNRGPHPEGEMLATCVGWFHHLHIDLWLVVFDFKWQSGRMSGDRYTMKP
jgi:hypothetical protein